LKEAGASPVKRVKSAGRSKRPGPKLMKTGNQTDVRSLIQGLFREHGRESDMILEALRSHWPEIVGESLAVRCVPTRLKGNTLWVGATDACWAYELQFHKRQLLGAVEAFLESDHISDLRFAAGLPEGSSVETAGFARPAGGGGSSPAPLPPTGGRLRAAGHAAGHAAAVDALPEPDRQSLEKAAGSISDPVLKESFRRTMAAQRARQKKP